MSEERLNELVEKVNKAFHVLIYGQMLSRTDYISEKMKGLSQMDIHIISMAYERPDLIMREIREYLKIPQTTLSSIVSKLEKLNLIQRVINRRDMRSFSIAVTEKGREIVEEHRRIDRQQVKSVLMGLEENEREEFARLLKKAADNAGFQQAMIEP